MGLRVPPRELDPVAVGLVAATLAFRWAELGEDGAVVDVAPNVPQQVLEAAEAMASNWTPELSRMFSEPIEDLDTDRLVQEVLSAVRGPGPVQPRWLMAEELWSFDGAPGRFDAITGPLPYSAGAHAHDPGACISMFASLLARLHERPSGGPGFAAAAALHDTLPPDPSAVIALTGAFGLLPGAIPTIMAGTEHGSTHLTNGEFGFSGYQDLVDFRKWSGVDGMTLFNPYPFDWTTAKADVLETLAAIIHALLEVQETTMPDRVVEWTRTGLAAVGFTVAGAGGTVRMTLNLDPDSWAPAPAGPAGWVWAAGTLRLVDGSHIGAFTSTRGNHQGWADLVPPRSIRVAVDQTDRNRAHRV